ncbi:hydroxypyruvate isomerase family protein [Actinophytocola oryzae]|uniref:Hydroxypyruvate isomerase n=1 Tax=Actinophytocola oryzae TaxID=502181 RepID=A0A4V3FV65_9PSEU|nr:TIM barrel protein [Actinophytocola oryzae]TDV57901.1 hydroxypyruvate isomerase [Actinophytocola oryzae]
MVHRLPYLTNCSLLFTELPLLARPDAARAAGFDAVEFWWPFPVAVPDDAEVDAFVRAVRDAGVRLVGLNFFAGDMPAGDRGLVSWPGREREFADAVDVAVGIGEQLDVTGFNALYGNRVEGAAAEEQDELAVSNLAVAAAEAARIGATVLVEPVSGAPRYPLRTAEDVLTVVDRVTEADNLRLLADLYHLTVNGNDVDAVIATHTPRIGHVQIADAPGRHEPGTGTIPLQAQLDELEAAGYTGWVSLEYAPQGATVDGLDWLPRERRSTGSHA